MPAETFGTSVPPSRDVHAWMNPGGGSVQWNDMDRQGCSRWGLIKAGKLLSPGVLQRPNPRGGVNAQLAVTGVKV